MAVPFDAQRLAVTGAAVPVVENVSHAPTAGVAQYSISATGSLVYIPGGVQANQCKPVWVARNGTEQRTAALERAYMFPRISPDGQRVAVGIAEHETQLWLYDFSREALTRFTFEGNVNLNAIWTPDGKRGSVSIKQGGAAEHLLATGRRQWRAGAIDNQRIRPCSDVLVPGWTTAGLH
jgi:hypothetical protein